MIRPIFKLLKKIPTPPLITPLLYNSSTKPPKPSQNDNQTFNQQLKGLQKKDGILIDEQKIKQKIKQIKQRTQVQKMQKKRKEQKQLMKNYEITKDVSKVKKFRIDTQTQSLMKFEDVTLDQKPTIMQINSFNQDSIQVDNFSYPPKIILLPHQLFIWQVPSLEQLQPQHFKLAQILAPPPRYIVVACPNPQLIRQNKKIRSYLDSLKIKYDIVGVFQGVSNYNTVSNDEIQVMAFIYSGQEFS